MHLLLLRLLLSAVFHHQDWEIFSKAQGHEKREQARPEEGADGESCRCSDPSTPRPTCGRRVEEEMLGSFAGACRAAGAGVRRWRVYDGSQGDARPRGEGDVDVGLGERKNQGPWACILQGKRSDAGERAQAQRALRALCGAWFDPGVGPEYPRPRIPELRPGCSAEVDPGAQRGHQVLRRSPEFDARRRKGTSSLRVFFVNNF